MAAPASEDRTKISNETESNAHAPLAYALIPLAATAAGVLAYSSFRHETLAGVFMLFAAIFIGFFARERATVAGIIIPAYLLVLFTGKFVISAAYLGICTAIGVGAFLFRVNRLAFLITAVIATGGSMLLLGASGALIGIAAIPAMLVLSWAYTRTGIGEAVGYTASTAAVSGIVLGALFIILSPDYVVPEGIRSMGDVSAWLRAEFISRVSAAYDAAGITAGSGAVEQYVDSVIRLLPALAAITAEIIAYFSTAVCGAIFRTIEVEPEQFTNSPARRMLSPMCGAVYFVASVVYLILSGGDSSIDTGSTAAVVCENIMLALALPLAVFAVSWVRRAARDAGFAPLGTISVIALVISALLAGWQGICLFAAMGGALCLTLPIAQMIRNSRTDD